MLGTAERHRRKGYARVCAAAAVAMLAEAGEVPFAYVAQTNECANDECMLLEYHAWEFVFVVFGRSNVFRIVGS